MTSSCQRERFKEIRDTHNQPTIVVWTVQVDMCLLRLQRWEDNRSELHLKLFQRVGLVLLVSCIFKFDSATLVTFL